MPRDRRTPVADALIDFVLGTVYFDTSSAGRSFAAARRVDERRRDEPAADEVFAFGLETFLTGLEHRFGPLSGS